MNYYPFHIGDFRSGTANMSRLQRAIYRDLLDICYDTEKPLPLDMEELHDAVGANTAEEQEIVARLLRFKFVKQDDGYHHEICEKVIAEYHAKAEVAKANGKLGGRPPKAKGNPKEPSGLAVGTQPEPDRNRIATGSQANQEPITNNQEPKKSKTKAPAAPTFDPAGELAASGVSPQTAADWLALRKAKRAVVTPTVLKNLLSECGKAGLTLDAALSICCSRGWAGFEADWVLRDQRIGNQPKAAPLNEKFHFNHLDRSGDVAAMAASVERWGITVPEGDEEIEI